ncbi:superfamily II DNA/RNA helicase [Christiangramia gaetbulicola]|uniref:Superfamily II DNA/RNA helicase n=1 Tax=Christiangramia gaetbulicola TaxID=703340 RepID=A0A2T6AEB2_9FLAO|nr:DEAD/DEAH box helicase [Christiangramia gaetbulicola]PTX42150.1 superfamily II DNA/RNA helicase [Christiangramia gaetbulicola]
MANNIKSEREILNKLNISSLNPMQKEAAEAISSSENTILLSPTGTGKTLAFLLPLLEELDAELPNVQAMILVPSRELAIQIEQVLREMGTGFKANAVYGGRSSAKDKIELKHAPAILIGTPGRLADHLRRETFSSEDIKTIVLDEFDKSLEIGFKEEMSEIFDLLPNIEKRILTSATQNVEIPRFVGMRDARKINYLTEETPLLKVKTVNSPDRDKLESLIDLLAHIGNKLGIIFCNYKDSIERVSEYLAENNISHGTFHGGMEQQDRERALIKFRNGTHRIIIATDLAARGIDIPELNFIIHYQLPFKEAEFTHRNGRTARMDAKGTAYVLKWEKEELPEFIEESTIQKLKSNPIEKETEWKTLFISGGRKDKISKGDIAGLFFKQGNLNKEELGTIELKQDCSFVSVAASKAKGIIESLDNSRLKKKKVRIRLV